MYPNMEWALRRLECSPYSKGDEFLNIAIALEQAAVRPVNREVRMDSTLWRFRAINKDFDADTLVAYFPALESALREFTNLESHFGVGLFYKPFRLRLSPVEYLGRLGPTDIDRLVSIHLPQKSSSRKTAAKSSYGRHEILKQTYSIFAKTGWSGMMKKEVDVRALTSFSRNVPLLDYGFLARTGNSYQAFQCFSLGNGNIERLTLLQNVLTANPTKFKAKDCSLNVIVEPQKRVRADSRMEQLHNELGTFGMKVVPVDNLEKQLLQILGGLPKQPAGLVTMYSTD